MKKYLLVLITAAVPLLPLQANDGENGIFKDFKELTHKWYFVSDKLVTYRGLSKYCGDPTFQDEVKSVLKEIHAYDSALYIRVSSMMKEEPSKELKKTLRQIGHLEHKLNALSLSKTLYSECHNQRQLEREYKKVKNYFGAHSFDNQIVVTEVFLKKHVDRINKIMENIEDHFHHLDAD
jgi:hypothetical protein